MKKLYGKELLSWDGNFTAPVTRQYRVSLCTTCMGRLHDLRQTLPKNIEDNRDYPNVEFVVLDYNSGDGLEEWMRKQMMEHIESGLLAYYRTTEPRYYSMSHSRNVAFLVAGGDVVNNVDADNWTNPGFAAYVNRLANQCPREAIFAKGKRLLHGRIGFFKDEWIALGGYDERLCGYGHDDKDLLYRAWLSGFTLMWYGGAYVGRMKTPRAMIGARMKNTNWKETEKNNAAISERNLRRERYRANDGSRWGAARVVKDFGRELEVWRMNA
ncbi:MAG TPA: galactosyltransferase-related protein [Thermoguttaceae bacterium]|nr:galactosyltransferase-related protein [Thermoguttaceae bacterium]